jgi:hypothetical protein
MNRHEIRQEIDKMLTKKIDVPIILKYHDQYCQISKSGIKEVEFSTDVEDFTKICLTEQHFDGMKRHYLARIRNDVDSLDFPYAQIDMVNGRRFDGVIFVLIPE